MYIGPKSRTKRPRKTKIDTEVAHVTRDSDTTFKVKRSGQLAGGRGILWRSPAQLVKDERLVSKMESKTNFSRRLKQFDGLTPIMTHIYATASTRGHTYKLFIYATLMLVHTVVCESCLWQCAMVCILHTIWTGLTMLNGFPFLVISFFLWTHAQRASMLYFDDVFYVFFYDSLSWPNG